MNSISLEISSIFPKKNPQKNQKKILVAAIEM